MTVRGCVSRVWQGWAAVVGMGVGTPKHRSIEDSVALTLAQVESPEYALPTAPGGSLDGCIPTRLVVCPVIRQSNGREVRKTTTSSLGGSAFGAPSLKAIAKVLPEPGVEIIEVPEPITGPGQVKLRVEAASVCGTDLHIYNWDAWAAQRIQAPRIIGHEFCGTVVEVGPGVTSHQIGDFVASESHIVCGHCRQCRMGQSHVCVNTKILGVDVDGGFAPFAVIPAENARHTDQGVPRRIACFQDALGNAVHTVCDGLVEGQNILITGMGPIGLFAATVCKALGAAKVIATEVMPYRIDLAHQVGVDAVLHPGLDDVEARILEIIGEESGGVDAVLEMSGHPNSLALAIKSVRPGGRISLLGVYPTSTVPVDMDAIIFKGLKVHGIVGRELWRTWEIMGELLKSGKLVLDPVITHTFPYTQFKEAMELMKAGKAGKVVFTFEDAGS